MRDFLARPVMWAIGIALLLLFVGIVVAELTSGQRAKTEAKLGKNTTEAAQQSGQDAVNVVGKAGDREAAVDELTRANEREIRNAEGADAPVAGAARDAGLRSLCKRAAYRGDPKCVQFANP